jgi:hypothetical protein
MVRRQVAALMERLSAGGRFEAGLKAAQLQFYTQGNDMAGSSDMRHADQKHAIARWLGRLDAGGTDGRNRRESGIHILGSWLTMDWNGPGIARLKSGIPR